MMTTRRAKRRQTALVTGASSGIGAELARCFAQGGCDLVLVARHAGRLRSLARALEAAHPVRVRVARMDLSRPGAAEALAASMRRRRIPVDILVNNAGIVELGRFAAMPAARSRQLVALNVAAATALLSCFLPPMVRRAHGRVLNVCSIASFLPVPSMATYAATKAYLLSLSESLSEELDGTGVTITALCPGVTQTPMKATVERAHPRVQGLPRLAVGDAAAVAAEGYEACMRGEAVRVPGLFNRVTTLSGQTLPRWLVRRVAGILGRQAM
jgi:short-subunit dehydrogenase